MVPFYLDAAVRAGSLLRGHRSETGPLSFCRSHTRRGSKLERRGDVGGGSYGITPRGQFPQPAPTHALDTMMRIGSEMRSPTTKPA